MVDHLWPSAHGRATAKQRLQQGRQALKHHAWLGWLLAGVLALLISTAATQEQRKESR